MTPYAFRFICRLLWGDQGTGAWGPDRAAEFLRVSPRNIYKFAAGRMDIPPGVVTELRDELRRRVWEDPNEERPGLLILREALGTPQPPGS